MSDVPPPPPPPPAPPPPPGTPPPPPPPGGFMGGAGMPSMSGGPRSHPQAGKWLAAAIVSIFCCAIVLGPVVWINTSIKLKEMDAQSGVVWTNRGTMNAARIVSIVSTVLGAVSIIYLATVR